MNSSTIKSTYSPIVQQHDENLLLLRRNYLQESTLFNDNFAQNQPTAQLLNSNNNCKIVKRQKYLENTSATTTNITTTNTTTTTTNTTTNTTNTTTSITSTTNNINVETSYPVKHNNMINDKPVIHNRQHSSEFTMKPMDTVRMSSTPSSSSPPMSPKMDYLLFDAPAWMRQSKVKNHKVISIPTTTATASATTAAAATVTSPPSSNVATSRLSPLSSNLQNDRKMNLENININSNNNSNNNNDFMRSTSPRSNGSFQFVKSGSRRFTEMNSKLNRPSYVQKSEDVFIENAMNTESFVTSTKNNKFHSNNSQNFHHWSMHDDDENDASAVAHKFKPILSPPLNNNNHNHNYNKTTIPLIEKIDHLTSLNKFNESIQTKYNENIITEQKSLWNKAKHSSFQGNDAKFPIDPIKPNYERTIHSTPSSPIMERNIIIKPIVGTGVGNDDNDHVLHKNHTKPSGLPPRPLRSPVIRLNVRSTSPLIHNQIRAPTSKLQSTTQFTNGETTTSTRIDPATGEIQHVTSRTRSYTDLSQNALITEIEENIQGEGDTEIRVVKRKTRRIRPNTVRESRSMDSSGFQRDSRMHQRTEEIKSEKHFEEELGYQRSSMKGTLLYLVSLFLFPQASNRQLHDSRSIGSRAVLEEMETITLQPIGRGVHDLEPPTGSIARSVRANTPSGLLTVPTMLNRPHSSAGRIDLAMLPRTKRSLSKDYFYSPIRMQRSTIDIPYSQTTQALISPAINRRLVGFTQTTGHSSRISSINKNPLPPTVAQHDQFMYGSPVNPKWHPMHYNRSSGLFHQQTPMNRNSYARQTLTQNIQEITQKQRFLPVDQQCYATLNRPMELVNRSYAPGWEQQQDGFRTIATTNYHREMHTSGPQSPYLGTIRQNSQYEATPVVNRSIVQQSVTPFSPNGSLSGTNIGDAIDGDSAGMRQVLDTSKYWYLPGISRPDVIALLRDKEPGSFVIRNSNTYADSFGLALKIPPSSPRVMSNKEDAQSEWVRHFLIGTVPMQDGRGNGVHLRGFSSDPTFPSLAAFVHYHIQKQGALPCTLRLPVLTNQTLLYNQQRTTSLNEQTGVYGIDPSLQTILPTTSTMTTEMLYLGSIEVDRLENMNAAIRAINKIFNLSQSSANGLPKRCEVQIKVIPYEGIIFSEKYKRALWRKLIKPNNLLWCGMDPENREFNDPELRSKGMYGSKIFALVARKQRFWLHENVVYVFCESDQHHSAMNLVRFINSLFFGIKD
ncbi:unnamed protein product [Schistosoma turkestanicum]|nr:unnamed protein product [Schistosoma turkestanicum]